MDTSDFGGFQPSGVTLCLPSQYMATAAAGPAASSASTQADYAIKINSSMGSDPPPAAGMFRPYHPPATDLMAAIDKHSQFLQQLKKNAQSAKSDRCDEAELPGERAKCAFSTSAPHSKGFRLEFLIRTQRRRYLTLNSWLNFNPIKTYFMSFDSS
jgi:hypothetical protein